MAIYPKAAAAQILSGATSTTAAPTLFSDGEDCNNVDWICLTLKTQAATSSDFVVWTRTTFTGEWAVRKDLGSQGTITVVTATDGGVDRLWIFVGRCVDKVDVQLSAIVGAAGSGIDAWVEFSREGPYST